MKGWILTGTSRGLGLGLKEELLKDPENLVIGLSRSESPTNKNPNYHFINCDLTSLKEIKEAVRLILRLMKPLALKSLLLINNAGLLGPIKALRDCPPEEIGQNITTNLIAPAQLMALYLKELVPLCENHTIVNISSGAASKSYAGWSAYCAAKAGLERLTRTAALEQSDVKIIALVPGVVDTEMQEQIRLTDEKDFPSLSRFISLKKKGELLSSGKAAAALLELIGSKEIKNGDILDIRDFL